MSFAVATDYDRFMGRYSTLLAAQFADLAGVSAGQTVLDVGCGPGALTGELVRRLGAVAVSAVDPSEPFLVAVRERYPGIEARLGSAEDLPFEDDAFDLSLAQLVVHFMKDPAAGLAGMRRVTRSGGVVAACVWDHAGDQGPLGVFWSLARRFDPGVVDESQLAGVRQGHLEELFGVAGISQVEGATLNVELEHPTFEDWWEPFTLGVGPAGSYVSSLRPQQQTRLREAIRDEMPQEPLVVAARAWAARGVA
jgi:SAM-dependent methyltransferase